ncbi:MAG: hypothetical protein ACRD4V_03570, partial [Candidatus Acidiferrales bacterium]
MASPTLLWQGANGVTFSAITAALDTAKLPYNREDLDARLLFSSQLAELEIWVPASHLTDAKNVLDEVLSSTANAPLRAERPDASNEIPAHDYDESADDIRHEIPKELYPEDATAEVWSSNSANNATSDAANNAAIMAEILKSCLAEIGIACYVARPESADSDSDAHSESAVPAGLSRQPSPFAVRVLPEDEDRAKEIVRQVTDAAPPT